MGPLLVCLSAATNYGIVRGYFLVNMVLPIGNGFTAKFLVVFAPTLLKCLDGFLLPQYGFILMFTFPVLWLVMHRNLGYKYMVADITLFVGRAYLSGMIST